MHKLAAPTGEIARIMIVWAKSVIPHFPTHIPHPINEKSRHAAALSSYPWRKIEEVRRNAVPGRRHVCGARTWYSLSARWFRLRSRHGLQRRGACTRRRLWYHCCSPASHRNCCPHSMHTSHLSTKPLMELATESTSRSPLCIDTSSTVLSQIHLIKMHRRAQEVPGKDSSTLVYSRVKISQPFSPASKKRNGSPQLAAAQAPTPYPSRGDSSSFPCRTLFYWQIRTGVLSCEWLIKVRPTNHASPSNLNHIELR